MKILAVAAGGALGALARYGIGALVPSRAGFPWATFAINVSGCFAAGVLVAWLGARATSDVVSAGLLIGFLGAYTTFSAFAVQTEDLLANGMSLVAAAYVVGSVAIGVLAAWSGLQVGRSLS